AVLERRERGDGDGAAETLREDREPAAVDVRTMAHVFDGGGAVAHEAVLARLAFRSAVAAVIEDEYLIAVRGQPVRESEVRAEVLGVAVEVDDGAFHRLGRSMQEDADEVR